MVRDALWLLVCTALGVGVVGSAACAALGGPVKSPIVVDCHDGTTCPDGYSCPPYANPGGRCEYDGTIVQDWGMTVPRDAGVDLDADRAAAHEQLRDLKRIAP